MKNYFLYFSLFSLASLLFLSCTKTADPIEPPFADFDIVVKDSSTSRTISFTNKSKNTNAYLWDFGDGELASVDNPKHTYNQGGIYTVTLTARASVGEDRVSKTVNVPMQPLANFTIIGGGDCKAPCEITFQNRSVNTKKYTWDFGDGSTGTSKDPKRKYLRGGTYTVRLTATGDGGTDRFSRTISIGDSTKAPVANFVIVNGECAFPCEITFTNASVNATEFRWDFGDGNRSSVKSPKYQYGKAGVYTVRLTAINELGIDEMLQTVKVK
ncbi:MAG: PKD domain-containing protein [Bacteroidetes bacterium]|nr:MAG: PKD domain-containing protein [Bacteroidota bacterium]